MTEKYPFEEFKKKFPDLYNASFDEGRADGFKSGVAAGKLSALARGDLAALSRAESSQFSHEKTHNSNNLEGEPMNQKQLPGQRTNESLTDYIDRTWKSEAGIKDEFNHDFESYQAYCRAQAANQVKAYSPGSKI